MLGGLTRFLFGYDLFISYAYKDGREYAEELNKKLRNLDFACFFDASELPPGEGLPFSLRRAIGRSKALVLVGTEGSLTAPYVDLEVTTALKRKKVIPINVDGIRERVSSPTLRELPWVNEEDSARQAAGPSAAVLERIGSYFQFTRRNTITRRVVSLAALVFLLVAVLAVWQWRLALERQRVAIFQRDLALSRQLAGQSQSLLDAEPDLGLLLAAEAAKRSVTFEARDALLSAIQRYPKLVRLLHGVGHVRSIAFSQDGATLASANSAGKVMLWDVETGDSRATLLIPDAEPARRLSFDREGRRIAAYSAEAAIAVYDLTADPPALLTDTSLGDMAAFGTPVDARSAERDRLLAACVSDLREREFRVRTAALSPDSGILATSDGEEIMLWRPTDGKPVGGPLSAQEHYVRALAFAPNGFLASGSSAGTIALWDLSERPPIGRRLHGLSTSTNSLAFSPDGKLLAGGDYNGNIALWDVKMGALSEPTLLKHRSNIQALRFGPDGRVLASYGRLQATLWELSTGKPIRSISLQPNLGAAVALSPDLTIAALGGNSGELALWDLGTGKALETMPSAHSNRLLALAFSPDGRTLASAGNGRRIFLRDLATGEATGPLTYHSAPVVNVEFSGDGGRLASYDSDGTLIVWDLETLEPVGRPLQRVKAYNAISAMALSPDGQTAATSGPDGLLSLWDVQTWRPLGSALSGHPGGVNVITFSPDGKWMASGGLGGAVLLWDLRVESWVERVCRIANRDLTPREKGAYLILTGEEELGACEIVGR